MRTVLILLGLKWAFIAFAYLEGAQAGLFAFPILGLGGSSFWPLAALGALIDVMVIRAVILRRSSALLLWVAVSFAATFASGWIDYVIAALSIERSATGNALTDAFNDTISTYVDGGPTLIVELVMGTIYLFIDGAWHIILALAGLRRTSS